MTNSIQPSSTRSRYDRDGWFRSPEVLGPDALARLTGRVEALAERDGPEVVYEKGSRVVRGIHGCHLFDDTCRRLVRLPALLGMAEQLLGEQAYVYQFKVNMKQPGEGAAWPWHQDFAFWSREDGMPADRAINIAVLLDEVHAGNGPLRVIPGSHRFGLFDSGAAGDAGEGDWHKHVSADLAHTVPDEVADKLAAESGTELVTGPAGTLYAFHPSIVHSSSNNLSADRRALLLVTYNAVSNAPLRLTRPEFLVGRDTSALTAVGSNSL
ncbi:phytanoyl-CoA dioxygenase family protein [Actinokineospora diospyrosa]|uniref:Ectoine hydroxylase n=1 Tax=Actinokineospora diospyrosa TaxID=103728 RepID=A0ABT1IN68_9PSEU|nr:phytanoyl-CoA dioxygenase family protein [Actinokineospora diospyrosa]MCP2273933.1 ectoine hydroxylase [Actinokineospora diospyrosa]